MSHKELHVGMGDAAFAFRDDHVGVEVGTEYVRSPHVACFDDGFFDVAGDQGSAEKGVFMSASGIKAEEWRIDI
jgi:hypothetical protein